MAGERRKHVVASRRRNVEEGEDESGPETQGPEDDSMSEGSALSDLEDDDADAEGSELSEQEEVAVAPQDKSTKSSANGHAKSSPPKTDTTQTASEGDEKNAAATPHRTDTEAMLNGLQVGEGADSTEEVHFEDMAEETAASPAAADQPENGAAGDSKRPELPYERRRREQEEYKKKRDADPTFVPNRGGFFMHDHRHAGPAANGFRPFGRGRGRGRGAVGGPFSPANQAPVVPEPADSPWSHDLHESVSQHHPRGAHPSGPNNGGGVGNMGRQPPSGPRAPAPNRSFSKSTQIGNVQIRVYLADMTDPIVFSAVPVKQHTRLPQHRPPLRRDKPVRISIPNAPPRYIFPSMDRSFIFIPRALRPNQQGYGRMGGGRGSFSPYRGFGSRRTSAYGSSAYSPSVAMSRRSSLAKEVVHDSIVSPSGSTISRAPLPSVESGRPIVRLPPSMEPPRPLPQALVQPGAMIDPNMPPPVAAGFPVQPAFPVPQNQPNMYIHQPRPQKAVSVADIESPEKVTYPPPQQQQQQPFHQQVPNQTNGHPGSYPQDPSYNPHGRTTSYTSQPSAGTPLSQIPERAIHAQPFQPPQYQPAPPPPQGYYPSPYQPIPTQGGYYLSPPDMRAQPYNPGAPPLTTGAASAPVFVPTPQQHPYAMPVPQPQPVAPPPGGQGSTVAQESNGMVFYYDSSTLYGQNQYPPSGYPAPQNGGVVGMGGMMTPSPDGYYYPQGTQGPVYYPQ
ncbi:MAG: hypothetical protein M4579_006958 [Chaenotheca gracillima]|nr:MAG: hypothetical protein M4579_006958 [Chaenotheca gracillima]